MTELGTQERGSGPSSRDGGRRGNSLSRLFASVSLFVSQILDELRKVVRPTRSELWNYTLVVIVFVSLVMAYVALLDFGLLKLVLWAFGG